MLITTSSTILASIIRAIAAKQEKQADKRQVTRAITIAIKDNNSNKNNISNKNNNKSKNNNYLNSSKNDNTDGNNDMYQQQ